MDIKPVPPTPPASPLHRVEEDDMRRDQPGKQQQARDPQPAPPEQTDDGPHVDAYA